MKTFLINIFLPFLIVGAVFGSIIYWGMQKEKRGEATLGQTVVLVKDTLIVINYDKDFTLTLSNGKVIDYDLFDSIKLKK